MTIGELAMVLGLEVDEKEWSLGQALIEKMRVELVELAYAALNAKTDVAKAMDVIGIKAPTVTSKLKKVQAVGDKVASTFKKMLVAAGAFFVARAGVGMVKDVIDLGGKLNDTAQKVGLSAEALQEWGYAAAQNSSSLDEFSGAVVKLSKGLYSIKEGKGPVVDGFKKLGISMKDPAVKAKNLDSILMLVADKFAKMPDGPKKTAAAMSIFGKTGASLIPTLNKGSTGLNELRMKARDLGAVIDGKSVGALDDLGDSVDDAEVALKGLRNRAIIALVPLLQKTVTEFLAWTKANKDVIASKIQSFVEILIVALTTLAKVVAFAVEHWRALAVILAGGAIVSGIMSVVKAITVLQTFLATAAGKAVVSWAMILGPIFLIAAAVVGLGLLIYKFRHKFVEAFRYIKREFMAWVNKVKGGLSYVGGRLKAAANAVKNFFVGIATTMRQAWDDFFNWLLRKLKAIVDNKWFKRLASVTGLSVARDVASSSAEQALGATSTTNGRASASVAAAVAGTTVVTNSPSITVNAPGGDAEAIGKVVSQALRDHDETLRRQTASALGVE